MYEENAYVKVLLGNTETSFCADLWMPRYVAARACIWRCYGYTKMLLKALTKE